MGPGSITQVIGEQALIAVVEVDDAPSAAELARCLRDAGVSAVEITLRSPGALAALEAAAAVDGIVVGAGTVLSANDVRRCQEVGAEFLVSPVFEESVALLSRSLDMIFAPGAATPTEVHRALEAGFSEVKVFPAEALGGLALVRSLAAVFPSASFMPTGGIDKRSAAEYLAHPSVIAIGGSWIAPPSLIRSADWSSIEQRAREATTALSQGETR